MKFASPIRSFWSVECELKKFGDTLADILSKLVKIFNVKKIRATLQTKFIPDFNLYCVKNDAMTLRISVKQAIIKTKVVFFLSTDKYEIRNDFFLLNFRTDFKSS